MAHQADDTLLTDRATADAAWPDDTPVAADAAGGGGASHAPTAGSGLNALWLREQSMLGEIADSVRALLVARRDRRAAAAGVAAPEPPERPAFEAAQAQAGGPGGAGKLTYRLSDDAGGRFAIDPASGAITASGDLGRDNCRRYDIEVTASCADGSVSVQRLILTLNDMDEFEVSTPQDAGDAADEVSGNHARDARDGGEDGDITMLAEQDMASAADGGWAEPGEFGEAGAGLDADPDAAESSPDLKTGPAGANGDDPAEGGAGAITLPNGSMVPLGAPQRTES